MRSGARSNTSSLRAVVGLAVLLPAAVTLAEPCLDYDHIIDDEHGAPQFVLTGDDWGTWGILGCGYGGADSSFHYLTKTIGGPDKKGTASWIPDLPVGGMYEIRTWWRKTGNRTTDADHFIHDGAGEVAHVVIDQKGDMDTNPSADCKSGWVSLGIYFCKAGVGGCKVVLDGTDDDHSDEANAVRFTLKECTEAPPPPPPPPSCDYPGPGQHEASVYASAVTGSGWESVGAAKGEADGAEAHSPNVDKGEELVATFPEMCDPAGEETIDLVEVGVKLRTQYDSGKYDVLLRFHAGGPAQVITHHTQSKWDLLNVTADQPAWTWPLVNELVATLELHEHPGGAKDADVWVDAFSVRVQFTTTSEKPCETGELVCNEATLEQCVDAAFAALESCAHGCADGACLPAPPAEDSSGQPADVGPAPDEGRTSPPEADGPAPDVQGFGPDGSAPLRLGCERGRSCDPEPTPQPTLDDGGCAASPAPAAAQGMPVGLLLLLSLILGMSARRHVRRRREMVALVAAVLCASTVGCGDSEPGSRVPFDSAEPAVTDAGADVPAPTPSDAYPGPAVDAGTPGPDAWDAPAPLDTAPPADISVGPDTAIETRWMVHHIGNCIDLEEWLQLQTDGALIRTLVDRDACYPHSVTVTKGSFEHLPDHAIRLSWTEANGSTVDWRFTWVILPESPTPWSGREGYVAGSRVLGNLAYQPTIHPTAHREVSSPASRSSPWSPWPTSTA